MTSETCLVSLFLNACVRVSSLIFPTRFTSLILSTVLI